MTLAEKMTIAKALRAYAESQGYKGKRGKQNDNGPSYTSVDCADEFGISKGQAYYLLSCKDKYVESVSAQRVIIVKTQLETLNVLQSDYIPSKEELNEIYDYAAKEKQFSETPESEDDSNQPTVADMTIVKSEGKIAAKGPLAEMPSDLHVSNRLYSVEGKCKEIADYMKQYKLHYKAVLESLRTIRPLTEDTLLEKDPWFLEYEVTLIRIIHHLDVVIEKLENL